ncbi:hypothetical protein G6F35_018764 [Rhizopus arrhizus]|nr:hypothetical protein G6F35_018764 [Rhizopus arrhizus]KAG1218094.1 hypothetical protein G6F68_021639 [Rhizopus microsporus]
MPATAASAEPIRNAAEMTVLMFTPIRPATSRFCAVARIAVPRRVLCTTASRPPMISAAITTMAICSVLMRAPANSKTCGDSTCGKFR